MAENEALALVSQPGLSPATMSQVIISELHMLAQMAFDGWLPDELRERATLLGLAVLPAHYWRN
jgi:hypothetical protein